jgi:hypothetical protein
MLRLLLLSVLLVTGLLRMSAAEPPKLREQCMDGVRDRFIAATTLSLKEMTEQLPDTEVDANGDKKAEPTKLVWGRLPDGAKATVESIADYRGREIYRIDYEWNEANEQHRSAILLAFRDPVQGSPWSARPFFLANDEEVTTHNAKVFSTAEHPFTVKVEILWRGSGHDWADFTYLFDERGPYLLQKKSGARRLPTKTVTYRGNKILRTISREEN